MPAILSSLWLAVVRFFAGLFSKSSSPLPVPVTTPNLHAPFPRLSLSGLFPLDGQPPTAPSPPSTPDRSFSPTAMSDGSLQVVYAQTPLPSPWSPTSKTPRPDVWMSVDGLLVDATGPIRPSLGLTASSLYSSSSALDAFGISVFVDLDSKVAKDPPKLTLRHEKRRSHTPRKRRDTLPARPCTPLNKLDNVGHVRSATSISSMAYELRMGLFADGRSMSTFENFITFINQNAD